MKEGMNIQTMLAEIQRREIEKVDYVAGTKNQIRMVKDPESGELMIVLLQSGWAELQRFSINETAHEQIATKLKIPRTHYNRLIRDYPDLVMAEVNTIFENEPSMRMLRTIDGKVRAFLSERYKAMDNSPILEASLPVIRNDFETTLLASNVTDDFMHIKCLFSGDELAHTVAYANGKERTIRPGFRLSNSETGRGSFKLETFFFDSYCTNGCVFGKQEAFTLSKIHLGPKLIQGTEFRVISEETDQKEFEYSISAMRDGLKAISDPAQVALLADMLREKAATPAVQSPIAAVDHAIKVLPLRDSEKESILTTFIKDQDFSQWGLHSAITSVANSESVNFNRACELEDIGGKLLAMDLKNWNQFVVAEAA